MNEQKLEQDVEALSEDLIALFKQYSDDVLPHHMAVLIISMGVSMALQVINDEAMALLLIKKAIDAGVDNAEKYKNK